MAAPFIPYGAVVNGGVRTYYQDINPGMENSFGLNTNDPNYYKETQAALTRANWERYKERFQPLEDYLFGMVNNPQYQQQQVAQNLGSFNQSFENAQGTFDRNLGRYGLTLNGMEQQAYDRNMNLTQGLGQVEAVNRTNRYLRDQEFGIVGAGTKPTTGG